MKREEFIEKFNKIRDPISEDQIIEAINKCADANLFDGFSRGYEQLIIVMEELAELAQEVSKKLRGKGDYYNLLQELADVYICIKTIQEICGVDDDSLQKALTVKIDRMKDCMNREGSFR